ncbi:MAG: CHASE2 domain-containing protein, partial [Elainellaceae cyanobacterium]
MARGQQKKSLGETARSTVERPWSEGVWRGVVPGAIGIGVVVAARIMGLLQPLELAALDTQLRWRPPEPTDSRVTVVGINEADIQAVGDYPIPDEVLAQLLRRLQAYDVEAIGLDIVRDLPVEPGHAALVEAFESMDNIVGAETIVPDRSGVTINPPPALPPEQVGFVDSSLDLDGNLRRSLLGATSIEGDYRFSLAIRLAEKYLDQYGFTLRNGDRDPSAMQFGEVELSRFYPNSGGYVRADAGGNQVLLNFRSGAEPFPVVSLMEVLNGEVDPDLLRDRVVLIGVMSLSVKDTAESSAVSRSNSAVLFGVEAQAHATSQIISAVLAGRPLLRAWPDVLEYAWIVLWGLFAIALSKIMFQPARYFIIVMIAGASLLGLGYVALLLFGIWAPVLPAFLAFTIVSVRGLLRASFYYDYVMNLRLRDRQLVIENTFTAIHNGPLQTLAALMREVGGESQVSRHKLKDDLHQLNQELRSVYDTIQQEVTQENQLCLSGRPSLDLAAPLHELLYEVYNCVLQRDRELPNLAAVKVKVVKFEPFDEVSLLPEQKRDL